MDEGAHFGSNKTCRLNVVKNVHLINLEHDEKLRSCDPTHDFVQDDNSQPSLGE
jgi:hypothetical protein